MGESLNPFGGSGGSSSINKKATAAAQTKLDTGANQQFVDNFMRIFGSPTSNPGFGDSLSGYFGGKPLQDIATNIAPVSAFHPKAKRIMSSSGDGDNGIFGFVHPGSNLF